MSAPSERGPGGAVNLALRVDAAFRAFVGDPRFPCLAGKGTVQGGGYRLGVYGALGERDEPAARWDPAVSADPADPHFAFSFAGCAMFVIGLHPGSSRLARRFRWPALVFSPRAQFERLRAEGRFERLRAAVREREIVLQGSLNPNLADFGDRSEARQYSGRETEPEWHCPFHRRGP
ncbi:MAG: guanitoxin biosynthesis heme-dependent pre-guanitoxin N-hydroxylase GntA [Gemmatimonadaceae bacterium]